MRLRSLFALALIVGGAMFLGSASGAATAPPPCSIEPPTPSIELVYLLQPGEERVTARSRSGAVAVVCDRLQGIGIGDAEIRLQGERRLRVVLPPRRRGGAVQRLAERLAAPGQLGFHDWEADLIGPERKIGGHPGRAAEASALARARREWREAGRSIHDPSEARLIHAGAFPRAYDAVELASGRAARNHCPACSASTSRFYMFDRSASHRLIAGPVSDRTALPLSGRSNLVLKVPVGTVVVSEQPSDRSGKLIAESEPGWFALRDRPALTAADIVDPKQEIDEFGLPNVTFGFTQRGRVAFQRVTREIAQCGQAGAIGPVSSEKAEALSCHLAVILDGEVRTRPIINFASNPDGIDGRTGAQIAGGFTGVRDARDLAAVLRTGTLPIDLTLVRQKPA